MKSKLGLLILAFCLLAAPAAHAAHHHASHGTSRDMVRSAQIRLSDLGYFTGMDDGILGPTTRNALRTFQRRNGLLANGQLTMRTYDLLAAMDIGKHQRLTRAGGSMTEPMPMSALTPPNSMNPANPQPMAPQGWHYVGSQRIPVQYGDLEVNEEAAANGTHRYSITLDGRPFLLADNQPGQLRISDVFHLKGEDAVVITAWRGEDNCKFKNYLVAVHANGAMATRHEFESCSPSSDAQEAHGALFIRFAATMNHDGFDRWDVWRYENDELVRL